MKLAKLEPGLIPIFRLLIGYWMLYWLVISPIVWLMTGRPGVLASWQYATLIAIQGVAFTLLWWSAAQRRLGRAFLPVVIAICTFSFFVEKRWFLILGTAPEATQGELLHAFGVRQDFVLLLLIVAWQYRFRYAVLYTLLISGIEWLMVLNADTPDHLGAAINSNSLITRAIIYLLAGYIVTGLMNRQRQQRHQLETANQRQAESNAKLARYAATIEQLSTSRERNRLARELHDTLAHSLSALSVQLEAVSALWEVDPAAARKMLTQADETTRTGLTEARRALQALRAAPLEESGLALALRDAARAAAKRGDLSLDLDVPELATVLSPAVEQGVYRIAQEALENVVRHARASQLSVKLACTVADLELSIRDDGLGFLPDTHKGDSHRFGLRGMQERAAILGATLQINSQPGQGAHICLKLELDQ